MKKLLLIITFIIISLALYTGMLNKHLSDSVVRLHVVANSNSNIDQEIKLKVRDEIINFMHKNSNDFKNKRQVESFILKNINSLNNMAQNVLEENNFKLVANTEYKRQTFPTKSYGSIAFPAGTYDALNITIGEGLGENWWCVMFPPVCMTDSVTMTVSDEELELLKAELTDEEYLLITEGINSGKLPVEIKFKFVEIIQSTKIKLSAAIQRIIN